MRLNLEEHPRVYVVMNPVSGTNDPEAVRGAIQTMLKEHELDCHLYETTGEENLRDIVQQAIRDGYRLFLSVGGDGTIAAVANALVGTDIPFVVIPNGTWNGLARSLDIPLQLDGALGLMFEEHEVREVDALEVDGQCYLLNVSAGVGSHTMVDVKRDEKRRLGIFYDILNGFNQLVGFQPYRFDVTVDGKHTSFRAAEVMVANVRNIALKAIELDPKIRMDDGKMHVCRIYASSLADYLSVGLSMVTGKQAQDWRVSCLDAFEEVEIRSRHKLPVQADGDLIGYLPLKVRLRKKAVRIVTPVNAQL